MNNFVITLSVIIGFILIYEAIVFFFLIRLKKKLKNGNLFTYKSELGYGYTYRVFINGGIKCKWQKRWVTVKASFDENSRLENCEFIPLKLGNIISKTPRQKLSTF